MAGDIRVAVLTVSDTAATDNSADKSGPKIVELVQQAKLSCVDHAIVPDDIPLIQEAINLWCYSGEVDVIITTGGTGFGVRDKTPEAVTPLLQRQASGLVHLLLASSLKHTPLASLSRPVAGTLESTLIVTLPGSVKAVKENLEALLQDGILHHAVDLVKGGSGKAVHASIGSSSPVASNSGAHDHAHHHHHHHGHDHQIPQPKTTQVLSHDPEAPVTSRHRVSPYALVSLEEALDSILSTVERLTEITLPVTAALAGHVLAEDVYSPSNIPPTTTTSVDGYAVSTSAPKSKDNTYTVVTSQTHNIASPFPAETIYRINTGGPLPAGTDAVIMVEDTRIATESDGEEDTVMLLADVDAGENVRAPGSDVKAGDLVMRKGDRIISAGGEVGTLAFVGRKEVKVYKKPIVAVLSTGNEIVDLQAPVPLHGESSWGGIWDTNRPSLTAALEGLGYKVLDLGIVADQIERHVEVIKTGLECADILISTGGTSMGPSDLLKPVIERHLQGTVHFGRVTIKPGKPTTFATIPWNGTAKPMFALPGNPASALVTFHVFVLPALRKLGGWPETACQYPRLRVQLQHAMTLDPRTEFHRVVIRAGSDGLKAESTGGQRSSRAASMSGANGLVILPQRTSDGAKVIEAGESIDAMLIGELQMM
ncbi:molybdenum cofactor biosynthesis protein [Hymenopellis radicata]|nr:molybdenum cofactor biosynthesis protein [Hymenopellis radicata]